MLRGCRSLTRLLQFTKNICSSFREGDCPSMRMRFVTATPDRQSPEDPESLRCSCYILTTLSNGSAIALQHCGSCFLLAFTSLKCLCVAACAKSLPYQAPEAHFVAWRLHPIEHLFLSRTHGVETQASLLISRQASKSNTRCDYAALVHSSAGFWRLEPLAPLRLSLSARCAGQPCAARLITKYVSRECPFRDLIAHRLALQHCFPH